MLIFTWDSWAKSPIYLAQRHILHSSAAGTTKCPHAQHHLLSHRLLKYLREGREEKFEEVKSQKGRKASNCEIGFFPYKATILGYSTCLYQRSSNYGLLWWHCSAMPTYVRCLDQGISKNTPSPVHTNSAATSQVSQLNTDRWHRYLTSLWLFSKVW